MAEEPAWPEVPGLDDWYDNAIKAGQGFKSDQERENYIKSIGDPMMHPLFAESTEDLEGNPLAEALRALREEDKSPIQIATMYKDEGNDWLKKGDKKSLKEAYDRYSHALNILEGTAFAAASGASSFNTTKGIVESVGDIGAVASLYPSELLSPHQQLLHATCEEEQKRLEDERLLKSQILSNRALVSLTLKNYGSCVRDADASLSIWSSNIKAHYRKCKALVSLRKFEEALICCCHGLHIEAGNIQLLSLREKCEEELLKVKNQLKILNERSQAAEKHWIAAWSIMSATKDRSCTNVSEKSIAPIVAGYASANQQPAQLREVLPHFLSNEATAECNVGWPVVLLYPQYSQIDVIEGVSANDMLAIHLAEMFPELADLYTQNDSMAVSWDRDREYQVSQLAVYAPLEAAPRINTLDEWLDSCREQSALRGELGVERSEVALKAARKRREAHELRLSQFKMRKPSVDPKNAGKAGGSSSSSSSGGSGGGDGSAASSLGNFSSELDRVGYLDVHLGCTFQHVLACPGHVLAGGLLTLLVFVRGNSAHTKFLKDIASNGHGVWSLNP